MKNIVSKFEMSSSADNDDESVILTIEGSEIKCSRKKLIQHSPYFEAMFSGNFSEKNQKNITLRVNINRFITVKINCDILFFVGCESKWNKKYFKPY